MTDIMLPEMSGLEMVARPRADGRRPRYEAGNERSSRMEAAPSRATPQKALRGTCAGNTRTA